MLAAGNDLSTVSYLAGHSSVRVTGDVYVKTLDNIKRNAALSFEKMLFPRVAPQEAVTDNRQVITSRFVAEPAGLNMDLAGLEPFSTP